MRALPTLLVVYGQAATKKLSFCRGLPGQALEPKNRSMPTPLPTSATLPSKARSLKTKMTIWRCFQ